MLQNLRGDHPRSIGDAFGDVAEHNDGSPRLEGDDMGRQAALLDAGQVLLWVGIIALVLRISGSVRRNKQLCFPINQRVQELVVDPGCPSCTAARTEDLEQLQED